MTDTIELSERMSAAELANEVRRLAALGGAGLRVQFSVHSDRAIEVYVKESDNDGTYKFFHGATIPETFAGVEEYIVRRAAILRNNTIRRMALALISLKDEHGACRRADLVRQFSAHEVETFEAEACARAGEMAAGSPFEIVP